MYRGYAEQAARWRVPLGFALGAAYVVLAQPTAPRLLAGGGVALGGLVLRAWAAGYLDKGRNLATGGPYAYTRNPLYLGSLLMGLGFVLAGRSWTMTLALAALFLFAYWPLMRREEEFLRHKFGSAYARYAESVFLVFPTRARRIASTDKFGWKRYRQNREYEAALGYLLGMLFLVLKMALR